MKTTLNDNGSTSGHFFGNTRVLYETAEGWPRPHGCRPCLLRRQPPPPLPEGQTVHKLKNNSKRTAGSCGSSLGSSGLKVAVHKEECPWARCEASRTTEGLITERSRHIGVSAALLSSAASQKKTKMFAECVMKMSRTAESALKFKDAVAGRDHPLCL